MILREFCENMMQFHRDVIRVQREMGRIGKNYRGRHFSYYVHNFAFYRRLLWVGRKERAIHFPKIIKDMLVQKKNLENLEANKRILKVYSNLNEAGANFT
jgi:hypothetical protein